MSKTTKTKTPDVSAATRTALVAERDGSREYTVVPLGYNVMLKDLDTPKKSQGGIILPDGAKKGNEVRWGTVVAVGEGDYSQGVLVPIPMLEGDTVCVARGRGTEVEIKGKKYVTVNWRECLFILRME